MTFIRFFGLIIVVICVLKESHPTPKTMEMIPERVEITEYNPKYTGDNNTITIRRLTRGGKYVVRVAGYNKHVWANNVTLFLNFYEFLHNEYRRSFVEMSYKYCDFINNNPYGRFILKYGLVCPLPIGYWDIRNITMFFPNFPYVVPFTKCKLEVIFKRMVPTEELIGKGNLYVKIQQT